MQSITDVDSVCVSEIDAPKIDALGQLQDMFAGDMEQVNQVILDQMQSDVPLIPQVASYLIASGGKRVRPLLTLAATSLFSGDMARAHGLAAAVEFIHTATLLHDDVVDSSDERRGKESANIVFGNEASVLVGDFLFSRAFQLMVAGGSLTVLDILSTASAVIAEGEVKQLSIQNDIDTSKEDYLSVIEGKTASLFAAACEVGPVIANQSEALVVAMRSYGHNLGMAFQIIDDLMDYSSSRAAMGKAIGDDFKEGKITAPILFSLQQADKQEREFWQRVIGDKEQRQGDFDHALSLIYKYDGLGQSKALAHDYGARALSALEIMPAGAVRSLLQDLINFTIERNF